MKAVDHKFTTMTGDHVQMVAMSMQNHLSVWMATNMDSIPAHGADRAYHDLRRKRADRFTLEAGLQQFDDNL